ncbi:DUF2500 domain-containing protein, partial [Serratia quinivorans]
MSKPPLFFIAAIALIAVLATQRYFNHRRSAADIDRAPVRSPLVTVSDKRGFPASHHPSRPPPHILHHAIPYA